MSKGLEALERIGHYITTIEDDTFAFCETQDYDTIEKALKTLEIIKRELKYNVDFVDASDFRAYIDGMICCESKEEIDLLKEVLL